MIGILKLISVPNSPKNNFFEYNSTLCPRGGRLLESIGVSGVIHLIGHIFMIQISFFYFGFRFAFWSIFPLRFTPNIHLFEFNSTHCPRGRRLLVSFGISGVIHLIGDEFMMQMSIFKFGF